MKASAGGSLGVFRVRTRTVSPLRKPWMRKYDRTVPYPKRLLSSEEEIIREFRPHWWVVSGPVVAAIVALAVIVAASQLLETPERWWVIVGAILIWMVLSLRRLLVWLTTQYVVTNERVIYRAGIASRRGKEIPLEVINDVAFSQSVWERMVRSGDLLIESAGEQGQSRFSDIPDPEGLQSLIYQVREQRTVALGRGGGRSMANELETLARLREQGVLSDDEFNTQKRRLLGDDVER